MVIWRPKYESGDKASKVNSTSLDISFSIICSRSITEFSLVDTCPVALKYFSLIDQLGYELKTLFNEIGDLVNMYLVLQKQQSNKLVVKVQRDENVNTELGFCYLVETQLNRLSNPEYNSALVTMATIGNIGFQNGDNFPFPGNILDHVADLWF